MGRASKRRERAGLQASRREVAPRVGGADPRAQAEAALGRLLRGNGPGRVSLAGAYALGYGALGLAQQEAEAPEWFDDLDPLDTLFLGTAWPQRFRDGVEFANALTAWLRLLRPTPHWSGIERFIREVLTASEEHDLPVDDAELMLLVAGRLEAAGLDERRLPSGLLPGQALAQARFLHGPPADLVLPRPSVDADERVARLWALGVISPEPQVRTTTATESYSNFGLGGCGW
jgi:hypothetical protein